MDWWGQVSYMETCYDDKKNTIAELVQFYENQAIRMMALNGYGFYYVGQSLSIDLLEIWIRSTLLNLKRVTVYTK